MPTNFPMPAPERVSEVLADLMGRGVTVARTRAVDLGGGRPAALADYQLDSGSVGVVCVADVRLTNALGAALTMVAPNVVEDAVASQTIDQPTIDNFREVVNVMTSLFNSSNTPHVKFRDVHTLPSQLPAETAMLLDGPKGRRDFDVTVDEYGTGTLSVLLG
jgi:hypothetical protein